MHLRYTQKGFTLIELMIIVAVIAVLASIGIPNYQRFLIKGYRADAQAHMMETAQTLQRYYSVQNTYGSTGKAPWDPSMSTSISSGKVRYNIIEVRDARSFILKAVPVGFTDDQCGELTLNNIGVRTNSKNNASCW